MPYHKPKKTMFFKRKLIVLLSVKNIGNNLTSALVLPQWISQDCSSIKNYCRILRYHMPEEAYSALSLEELGNGRAPFASVLPEVQNFSVFVQNGDLSGGLLLHIHTSAYVCVSDIHFHLHFSKTLKARLLEPCLILTCKFCLTQQDCGLSQSFLALSQ